MRFATLEIGGHPRPVVISGDHQSYCEVGDAVVGFDGDMTDLIARFPSPATAFARDRLFVGTSSLACAGQPQGVTHIGWPGQAARLPPRKYDALP